MTKSDFMAVKSRISIWWPTILEGSRLLWEGAGTIVKGLLKGVLYILGYLALIAACFIGAGLLGIITGTYFRLVADGSCLYFHVGKDWAEKAHRPAIGQANGFEAKTVSENVPFIDLSHESLGRHWNDRSLSKTDVIRRQYFKTVDLPYGTKYIPWLWSPNDPETPLTVMNGHVTEIMVVLIDRNGVEPRVGLIGRDDYEDFLRRSGFKKAGR